MRITQTPAAPAASWFAPGAAALPGAPAPAKTAAAQAPLAAADEIAAPRRNRFSVNRTAGTMPVFQPRVEPMAFAPTAVETKVEAGQRLGFKDLIDIVNPLQHLPLVGMAYRRLTGDSISPAAQFIGGTLFGGPLGAAAAMTDIAIRENTGTGVGDRMMNAITGTTVENSPIQLSTRWAPRERMAGTQPVWNGEKTIQLAENKPALPQIASGNLSPSTGFTMLLNGLTSDTPNIS